MLLQVCSSFSFGEFMKSQIMINDIPIKFINDPKNKKVYIKFVLINEYDVKTVTHYSLLCNVLSNTSKKYNTKVKVYNKLCKLYNANIYFSTKNIYKTRITTITLSFINDNYLLSDNISKDAIKFLYDFLLNPNLVKVNDELMFDLKVFNEEKLNLEANIKRVYNDKDRYAFNRILKLMCPNEIASIDNTGDLEDLHKITSKNLYDIYLELINDSEKYIYVYGDNSISLKKDFTIFNKLINKKIIYNSVLKENIIPTETKFITESRSISQAKLLMGFRTTISVLNDRYEALELFCSMFGGDILSNLFQVVREKHGLCYFIESFILSNAKLFFVEAGIDKDNYQKTIDLINEELNKYKQGIIDEDLFDLCKKNIINDLYKPFDNANEILEYLIDSMVLNLDPSLEIIKEKITNVTLEDIKTVANEIYLDTIYLLS